MRVSVWRDFATKIDQAQQKTSEITLAATSICSLNHKPSAGLMILLDLQNYSRKL